MPKTRKRTNILNLNLFIEILPGSSGVPNNNFISFRELHLSSQLLRKPEYALLCQKKFCEILVQKILTELSKGFSRRVKQGL